MPSFYKSVDCVIVSSNDSEACGLPIMESAAAGRLPISANIGILKEFRNPPGIVVPIQDDEFVSYTTNSLLDLMEDSARFEELCLQAQQFAFDHYDWKNVIGTWVELFDGSL